ncbi:MAG: MFS transporter [Chloroflexota bacterium]
MVVHEAQTKKQTKRLESTPNNNLQIGAVVLANGLLRLANNGTSALIGFYFASLALSGQETESFLFLTFAISAFLLGFLNLIVNVFEMLGALPFGLLIDRYSPRKIMVLGAMLGALATQMFNWGGGLIAIFFVSRMLEGLSAASVGPGLLSSLTDLTKDNPVKRSRVMSIFEVSLLIGLAAGSFVGGLLWDSVNTYGFSIMAVCYIAVALLSAFAYSNEPSAKPSGLPNAPKKVDSIATRLKVVFAHHSFRVFGPAWLALNAIVGMWAIQSPFLLSGPQVEGQYLTGLFTATQTGYILLLYAGIFSSGAVAWGFMIPNRSKIKVMRLTMFGLLLMCAFLFLLNSGENFRPWMITMLGVFAGLSILVLAGFTPAALTYMADLASISRQSTGTVMGAYSMLMGMGNAIGSFIGGWLAAEMAINGLISGTLVLTGIAIFFLFTGAADDAPAPNSS